MKQSICILSAFLSPLRSGAEAMVEEVASRLGEKFDVTIVTAKMRRELAREDRLEGMVRIIRVGIGHPIDKWLFPFLAPLVVRRLRPDIVHAVLESYAGLALAFCRFVVPGAKRLLTCQSTNTSLLLRPMHRAAHAVTVISRVLLERAKRFGREAVLIPNGIDLPAIRSACEEHLKVPGRVLFVGRLEKMKGVDTLLTAFAEVTRYQLRDTSYELPVTRTPRNSLRQSSGQAPLETRNSKLIIIGSGSLRSSLERLARDLGVADRVTFTGYLSGSALLREYAEAEIFAGLSRSEALGNVFLEAQAAGCAVVATNVGGIPDIVQNEATGILVSPDDAVAASAAMKRLIEDATLRDRLAAAGKENAEHYDWEAIAERYAEAYQHIVS